MHLGTTALVLNGIWMPVIGYLDYIGKAGHAEPQRTERDTSLDCHVSPALAAAGIGAFVQDAPFSREAIFSPLSFIVNKRTLPWAVKHVLER